MWCIGALNLEIDEGSDLRNSSTCIMLVRPIVIARMRMLKGKWAILRSA